MSGTLWSLIYVPIVRSILEAVPPSFRGLGVFADDLGLAFRRRFEVTFALEPVFLDMKGVAGLHMNARESQLVDFSGDSNGDACEVLRLFEAFADVEVVRHGR